MVIGTNSVKVNDNKTNSRNFRLVIVLKIIDQVMSVKLVAGEPMITRTLILIVKAKGIFFKRNLELVHERTKNRTSLLNLLDLWLSLHQISVLIKSSL